MENNPTMVSVISRTFIVIMTKTGSLFVNTPHNYSIPHQRMIFGERERENELVQPERQVGQSFLMELS